MFSFTRCKFTRCEGKLGSQNPIQSRDEMSIQVLCQFSGSGAWESMVCKQATTPDTTQLINDKMKKKLPRPKQS